MREAELDWRSVVALMAAFAGLVVAGGLVASVPRTLGCIAVATLLALGLHPLVSGAQRRLHLPAAGAVAVVLAGFGIAFAVLGMLLVPPAVDQAEDIREELPEVVADFDEVPIVGDDLVAAGVPERVERFLDELPDRLTGDDTPLLRIGRSAADVLLVAVTTLLFVVTLLVDGGRLLALGRRLLPERRRERADRVADLVYRVVGRYVAGSLLVAGVAGLCTLVAGLLLGVPLTPLLALWVMAWDLVPQIGGAAGGVPFVLFGLTQGPLIGLACAAFFVVYLQIENNVLGPLLVGQAVKLSPPATMVAALVGVSAGGVVGALLAVPTLGAAKAIYLELRPPEHGPDVPAPDDAESATARP